MGPENSPEENWRLEWLKHVGGINTTTIKIRILNPWVKNILTDYHFLLDKVNVFLLDF